MLKLWSHLRPGWLNAVIGSTTMGKSRSRFKQNYKCGYSCFLFYNLKNCRLYHLENTDAISQPNIFCMLVGSVICFSWYFSPGILSGTFFMGSNFRSYDIQDDNTQQFWDPSESTQSQFHLLRQMAKCIEFLQLSQCSVPHQHIDFLIGTYGRFGEMENFVFLHWVCWQ